MTLIHCGLWSTQTRTFSFCALAWLSPPPFTMSGTDLFLSKVGLYKNGSLDVERKMINGDKKEGYTRKSEKLSYEILLKYLN